MLIRLVFAVVLLFSASNVKVKSATIVQAPKAVNPDWWKTSVIYQIYPRTFKDSDNDGIGDIKGITSKLEHLKDAGVTAAWLSPIYKSPQIDAGYDISNYTEIDPDYGTMQDFEDMVKRAHDLGIKIIMDFVPNHSSNEHDWFKKSEERDPVYMDYYIWKDGKDDQTPPNNWVSHFKGSAWSFSTKRKQWYLHQFAPEQPDLNYRNDAVKREMEAIIKFWLDKGVDGFRMDAVPYLIEDDKFEDEPLSGDPNAKEGDYEYLTHSFTSDQDGTYDIIYEWRAFIDQYNKDHSDQDPKIMMTEAYTSLEKTMKYYTDGTRDGAHFTFNFLFITDLTTYSKAQDIVAVTERWLNYMPAGYVANWVLGNHDNHRVATRFGPETVDGLNMLIACLPGVMVTYNGEEIGQENGDVPRDKCKDPRACKLATEEEYRAASRDFERTPFHWDDTPNAGFTTGGDPWLPVSDKYKENNLAKQSVVGINSHYHTYKELLKLRQIPGFGDTVPSFTTLSDNVIAFIKSIPEGDTYVVVINIAGEQQEVDLSGFTVLNKYVKVVVANSNSKKHNRVLTANKIVLEPYESFVAISLETEVEGNLDWWKHAVVYQIYPLSFKDDIKNDGIGDIRGIISKLGHLEDAGVTAAWLSPIYKSPDVDQGYDISDFKMIDEKFGTMEDFEQMVAKAHEKGLKIIMDFVPNHSSNEHQWFIDSENKKEGYEDYYIWKSSENDKPPNNWKSIFGGSAWEYSNKRKQWYLHQFAKEQPDLNYRNPAVVKEMKDVLEFWLDKGVDGFRMDAVPYLLEDEDFRDDKLIQGRPGTEWSDYDHIRTSDQDGTFDMIYQWREFVDDYSKEHGGDARVLMTEAYTDIKNTMKYYGDGEGREGAHFTFNFQLITKLNRESNAKDIKNAILEWLENMPEGYTANWVLGNHDNHRVATRFGPDKADGFNMLIAILPGVMVTYNGEEIAQENGEVPYADCKDPSVCGKGEAIFLAKGRDFERTPFHWDDTANAGFNNGNAKPWLPVSEKHLTNNLKAQSNSEEPSHYQVYKQLLELREKPTLVKGEWAIETLSANVLGCTRTLEGSDSYIYLFNVGNAAETIDIKKLIASATPYLEVVLTDSKSPHTRGQLVVSESIELGPHESIIARTTNDVPSTPKPTTTTTTTTTTTNNNNITTTTTTTITTTTNTTTTTTTITTTTTDSTTNNTNTTTTTTTVIAPNLVVQLE